jgi:glucosamine 6-phosphate synthetase-like amidotransferase/phosphosugar isomerase protein
MCGIFGSTKLQRFKTLYTLNQDRGSFAYGGLYIQDAIFEVQREQGIAKIAPIHSSKYHFGHTQAPTSSEREFSHQTSHPFRYGDWIVAHNGILSNTTSIIEEHWTGSPPSTVNNVDSSIIPALIDHCYIGEDNNENEIKAIIEALEIIKGTFGLWVYNTKSHNAYIARVGSTLFVDDVFCRFSSKQDPYSTLKPIEEGKLYKVEPCNFTQVGQFKYNSPFFIL